MCTFHGHQRSYDLLHKIDIFHFLLGEKSRFAILPSHRSGHYKSNNFTFQIHNHVTFSEMWEILLLIFISSWLLKGEHTLGMLSAISN